jgi:hypothetical protein
MQILFGFIPELLPIRSRHFDMELTWVRMLKGHQEGECLIVICTGNLDDTIEVQDANGRIMKEGLSKETGLLSNHAYACLDVR